MKSLKKISIALTVLVAAGGVFAADHPDSGAKCETCHDITSTGEAPKVIPEQFGFFDRLFGGKKSFMGHEDIGCTGKAGSDGSITGCHAPELGFRSYLAVDMKDKAIDEFCGKCHAEQRDFGFHHPSYKMDKDGDGVGEYLVRPASVQEVFTTLTPEAKGEPLASYPDTLVLKTDENGRRYLDAALPLEAVVELEDGKEVVYKDVIGCTTCHNPHFGFLVELGKEEEVKQAQLASRREGDALLRMRDYDNALCDGCH